MSNKNTVRSYLVKFLITFGLLMFLSACENGSKVTEFTASLRIVLDIPGAKRSKAGVTSRALSQTDAYSFDRVMISVLSADGRLIHSADILASGGNITLTVPPKQVLIVRGEAFAAETVEFAGETTVAPIAPGGKASASFDMHRTVGSGVIQIDVGIGGKPVDGISGGGVFSKNNFVIYDSSKTNLVENGDPQTNSVYLSNIETGETTSLFESGVTGPEDQFYLDADISADGQFVVFSSLKRLVQADGNSLRDVYLKNTVSGELKLIRALSAIQQSTASNYEPSISDDGRYIVFTHEKTVNDRTSKELVLYDRLQNTYINGIGSGHRPVISGNGSVILFMKDGSNALSIYDVISNTVTGLLPVQEVAYPRLHYAISFDGKTLAFSPDNNVAEFKAKQVYVIKTDDLTIVNVSVDDDGNSLRALTDFHLSLSLDDAGRFLVFNFNTNIYVRDLTTNTIRVVAAGEQPFISPDGFDIAYTYNNNIFSKKNIFLEDIEEPAVNPIEIQVPGVTKLSDAIGVSWDAVDTASYYRIYASTQANIEDRKFQNSRIYETTDASGNVLLNHFSLSESVSTIFFVVVAVSSDGEFVISSEGSVEAYVPPVEPPMVNAKSGLFQFDYSVSVAKLEGLGECPDASYFSDGSDGLVFSSTYNIRNSSTELFVGAENGVSLPVTRNGSNQLLVGLADESSLLLSWNDVTKTYDIRTTNTQEFTDVDSNVALCEVTFAASGVRKGYPLTGNENFEGSYIFGERLPGGFDNTVVDEMVYIRPNKSEKSIDFGIGVTRVLDSYFDPQTGAFYYVADEFATVEERGGDSLIDDLVVDRITINGIFSKRAGGAFSAELTVSVTERIFYDSAEVKDVPDLETASEYLELNGKRITTRTLQRSLTLNAGESAAVWDLIGIANPPVRDIAQDDNFYIQVYPQGQPDNLICKNAEHIRLDNKPDVTFGSTLFDHSIYSYIRCLLPQGTLQIDTDYVLRLYSDKATENPEDDVLLDSFVHSVVNKASPSLPIDISQVTVNGLKPVNGVFNGFIGESDTLDFNLPVTDGADKYFVRLRETDNAGWGSVDKELRAHSDSNLVVLNASDVVGVNEVRIMTRHGIDPMAVSVSDERGLVRGVSGDFKVYIDLGASLEVMNLHLTTDANGRVSCLGESSLFTCSSSGSIDWASKTVNLSLYDSGSSLPDALYPFQLQFYQADRATVIFGGGSAGSAYALNSDPGNVEFQSFSLIAEGDSVDISWSPVSGAIDYAVYWSDNIEDLHNLSGLTPALVVENAYLISGLSAATTYYFKLVANLDGDGEVESIVRSVTMAGVSVLESPKNVTLTPFQNAINISWDAIANTDLVEYEVFYSEVESDLLVNPPLVASAGLTSDTSFYVSGLSENTTYYVKIVAHYDLSGMLIAGSVVQATQTLTPPEPTFSPLLEPAYSTINVSWSVIAGAVEYELYVSESSSDLAGPLFGSDLVVPAGTNSYQLTGLTANTMYFVKLIAVYADATRMESAITSVNTLPASLLSELTVVDSLLNECISLQPFTYVEEVVELNCSDRGVSELSGIEALVNLEVLDLSYNPLNSYEKLPALSTFNKLRDLDLTSAGISALPDLTDSAVLFSLLVLGLSVADFNFPSLEILNISNNGIELIPDLISFPNLSQLYLSNNLLTSVPDFSNMPNLWLLELVGNQLTGLPVLSNLNALYHLDLGNNQIATLPLVNPYSNLGYLGLSNNGIAGALDFDPGSNIYSLDLSYNQITSVPDFVNSSNLDSLYLEGNALSSAPTFDNLSYLRWFSVDSDLPLPCEIYKTWDARFDYRDGSRQGDIMWGECNLGESFVSQESEGFESAPSWAWEMLLDGVATATAWEQIEGGYASTTSMWSPSLATQGVATMKTTLTHNVDTVVSFAKKIDTFVDDAYLVFRIDGVEMGRWDGNIDWSLHRFDLPAGTHTLEWQYEKTSDLTWDSFDAAWIDDVTIYSYPGDVYEYLDYFDLTKIDDFDLGVINSSIWSTSTDSLIAGNWTIISDVSDFPVNPTLFAQAPTIDHLEFTSLSTNAAIVDVDGYVTFDAKISSERTYDFMVFYINGFEVARGSGDKAWVNRIFPVTVGDVLEWRYEKDGSVDAYNDTFWLDNVKLFSQPIALP